MPHIKLIRHPYKDHEVGEICDFGEEKNKSLVELGRAVYKVDAPVKKKKGKKSGSRKSKASKK